MFRVRFLGSLKMSYRGDNIETGEPGPDNFLLRETVFEFKLLIG